MAYECMSFLPEMTDKQIAAQVDYMIGNGWTPCVEFEDRDKAICKIDTALGPGYYHNRYWNMWKLPLFGCSDGTQVITEIKDQEQTLVSRSGLSAVQAKFARPLENEMRHARPLKAAVDFYQTTNLHAIKVSRKKCSCCSLPSCRWHVTALWVLLACML